MTGFLYQISAVLKFDVDTVNKGLKIKIKMIEEAKHNSDVHHRPHNPSTSAAGEQTDLA